MGCTDELMGCTDELMGCTDELMGCTDELMGCTDEHEHNVRRLPHIDIRYQLHDAQ